MSASLYQSRTMESMSVPKLGPQVQAVERDSYKSVTIRKDIDSLFNVTEDVLRYSASVAARCLLGNTATRPEIKPPVKSNFSWSILKQICCKVSCEKESDVIGSIEKITQSCSWADRAVLTLAAFASSYGELSCQIEIQEANRFAQLVSWLKQVNALPDECKQNKQFRKAITDLNNLTFLTLNLVKSILQLERLSNPGFDIEHQSLITNKKAHVDHFSNMAIWAAVSCMDLVNYLTFDSFRIIDNITNLISDITGQLPKLEEFIRNFESEIVEWAYLSLGSCFRWPMGIVHLFTRFTHPQAPQLDGPGAEKPFGVEEVLTGQNVLLFISEVTIPRFDYLAMQRIQEVLKAKPDYKIVWVPVVQKWTPDLEDKLKDAKKTVPWYILSYKKREPIVGIDYIKKQWQYCYRPMVVVLNSQGGIVCPDAMHMIRICGVQAFPFTPKPRPVDSSYIRSIILDLVEKKLEEKHYILLYGGTQKSWLKSFLEALIKVIEVDYFKTTEIAVVPFSGEKVNRKEVIVPKKESIGQFWNSIDNFLCFAMQDNKPDDQVTKDLKKLVSLRYEHGWAALCQGSNILVCASGEIIYEAVSHFNNWKNDLHKPGATFESCLLKYIQDSDYPLLCRHVSLQNYNGWLTSEVICPDCNCLMERMVTYKCCHPI